MKKIAQQTISVLLILVYFLCLASCSDSDRESLDLSADVTIHSFSINGELGVIDNQKMKINVTLPPKTDVTSITPIIVIDANATINPSQDQAQDFTQNIEYTVTNGNLYNKYTVSVEVLSAKITSFVLNDEYNGIIDNSNNTIRITVPTSVDVSNMTPKIKYTEGATISPESEMVQDFSNPVTYTLTFMNETFSYTVSVIQSDYSYAFLGTAPSVDKLKDLDEKTAAEWMLKNIFNSRYIPLESIANNTVSIDDITAIWFHYNETNTLPTITANKTLINILKNYYNNGGNIFLSGIACLYTGSIGITSTTYVPNNPFGSFGSDPQVNAPGEQWGISITGNEDHMLFNNLMIDKSTQAWPVIWFIGKDISWRRNIGCPWDLVPPYTRDWTDWSTKTGGIPLASFNWDHDCNEKVAISIFEGGDGKGTAICIGAPSYDWYYDKENTTDNSYYSNIEKITENVFNYLSK